MKVLHVILFWLCAALAVSADNAATLYQKGATVYGSDPSAAFSAFGQAAEAGHVGAMMGLATCYEKGHGTEVDYAKALEWYEKAARLKSIEAVEGLARIYASCPNPRYHSGELAVRFAKPIARAKPRDAGAQGLLAAAYARNFEFNLAMQYGRKAASLDERFKHDMEAYGEKIPSPPIASRDWLLESAAQGSSWAMGQLGIAALLRSRTDDALTEGGRWIEKAASAGRLEIYEEAGDSLFEQGEFSIAKGWYDKAAETKYRDANRWDVPRRVSCRTQYNHDVDYLLQLARKSWNGNTGSREPVYPSELAYYYLEVAELKGSQEAKQLLKLKEARICLALSKFFCRRSPRNSKIYLDYASELGFHRQDELEVCAYVAAELGDFETAVKNQQRLVEILKNSQNAKACEVANYRLERYLKNERSNKRIIAFRVYL